DENPPEKSPSKPIDFDGYLSPTMKKLFIGSGGGSWLYLFQLQEPPDAPRVPDWLPDFQQSVATVAPSVKLDWFGAPVQELHMHLGAKKIQILNLVIVLAVLVGFRFFFGTWMSGIVFWVTMTVTLAIVYGGFALSGGKQDLVFLSLFMVLTVASLEDFIFVALAKPGETATLENFRSVALPSFLTSLTTAFGFASLLTSELQAIRLFGVWAAVGAMVEYFVVFMLLPAAIRLWPRTGQWVKSRPASESKGRKLLAFRLSPLIGLGTFAIFSVPLFNYDGFRVTQSPAHVFTNDHEVTRSFDRLVDTRGWIGNVDLVLDGGLARLEKRRILDAITKEDAVSLVDDADSLATMMTKSIEADDLRDLVTFQLKSLPAGKRYFADSGRERAWVFLETLDINEVLRLRDLTREVCPEGQCGLEGEFMAFSEYSKSIVQTLFSSFLVSLVLVGLVLAACAYASGKMRSLPVVLISSFWAPFAILFVIWIFRIEVNFVTSVVLSVLVGLTGDNAIQYLFADDDLDEGAKRKGHASLLCSVSMIGVSLLFMFAPFEPTKLLGGLLALGFALVFIGDYSLLRGFSKPGSRFRAERPPTKA
ncbi:MAG: hypothetical protein V4760_05450, partial [Bdellovibrionota bacterium]